VPVQLPEGFLRSFTDAEKAAMEIETLGVRDGSHGRRTREVDQNTEVRTYRIKADQFDNFTELVCGRSVLWDDAGTIKLSRLLPAFPFGRDLDGNFVATKIPDTRGRPFGTEDGNRRVVYDKTEVDVFYEQAPYTILLDAQIASERDRYVWMGDVAETESEPIGPLAMGFYKYVRAGGGASPHGDPVPFGVSVFRQVQRFTIWHGNLPYNWYKNGGPLWNRIFFGEKVAGVPDGVSYLGAVNSTELAIADVGTWGEGKLLLEKVIPIPERHQRGLSGTAGRQWRIGFRFAYAARGWLNLVHPQIGTWEQVANDGAFHAVAAMPDFVGLYNVRDFANLFSANY
jgi:hypothetical protein